MIEKYLLIQDLNFEKVRNKIKENRDKKIIFSSSDDELNRKVIEKEKIQIFLPILSERKDFQKQRNSGLNQVIAKEMKKNHIKLGVSIEELTKESLTKKQKSEILGRITQNINLCKKNNIKLAIILTEKRDPYDLKSLGLILGVPTKMLKEMEFVFLEQPFF